MPIAVEYFLASIGAILLACFAAYLGFRSGIRSDKRKEFNEIADPLREKLRSLQESLTSPHVHSIWPEAEDFNQLIDRASLLQKISLIKAVENYKICCKESCGHGNSGDFEIWNEGHVRKCISDLLLCIRRK